MYRIGMALVGVFFALIAAVIVGACVYMALAHPWTLLVTIPSVCLFVGLLLVAVSEEGGP